MSQINNQLTDKDRMADILNDEKSMIKGYSTYVVKASCPELRDVLSNNMMRMCTTQYQTFDLMRQRNWYPIKPVNPQDVQEANTQFQQL